ncbi:Protein TolB [bacterium HR15]|nr:Protein TolB [bacterium HR15]
MTRWQLAFLWSSLVAVSWAQSDILWRQPILSGQAVVYSPDGQYLAAASLGGQIALYQTSSNRLVRVLRGNTAQVNALAFSPNSQLLASACDDGKVRLYQVATGTMVRTIDAHSGASLTVAFSPDGSLLASGGTDNNAKLWNASTGAAVRTLSGHSASVGSLTFSPDGQRLATGGWDGTLRIWQVSDGALLQNIDAHSAPIYAVAWSPDGATLATGSSDWDIKLWSASDGSWQRTLSGHSGMVSSLAFTPDGSQLISGSWDATIRVWNFVDGSPIRTLTGHTREVLSLALAPDGTRLASGGGEHAVRLWRVSDGTAQGSLAAPADAVYGAGFVAGGSVVSAGFDAVLRRWNASDGSFQQAIAQDSPILALAVSPDGTLVATGDWNGNISLRSMPSGTLVGRWSAGSDEIKSLAFAPNGSALASASMDGTVQLWAVPGGTLIRTLSGHTGGATAVAFSADGSLIATGDSGGVVRLWDASTGNLTRTINAHGEYITALAFSPSGARLATSSTDSTARLWDVATGTEVITLPHPDVVSRVAYTPDGSLLLTTSWDGAVRVWNAGTGAFHSQLNAHDMPIHALAISPDGQTMLTGGEDGLVYAWVSGPPNQPPDTPVLISPDNNARLTGRTPTFQIQASDPNGDRVQVTLEITASDNRTHTYQSHWVDSGTTVSIDIPAGQPLAPGSYTWRARATDERGASGGWSQSRILTIANQVPGKPVILEPADNATVTPTPTFRLRLSDPDNDPVRAVIEITGNNQTLSFDTQQVNSGNEVSFTVPQSQALAPGNYTWRAKTLDLHGGDSGWTDTRRFIVPQPSQPPEIPVLISPSDGSTVTPTPTFRVRLSDPNSDTVKAIIEITSQPSGTTRTLETGFVASGSEASVAIPTSQPLSAGSYTWRARAQDSTGNFSVWSGIFTFTVSATNRPPDTPVMLEPADNATVTSTPTFRLRLSDPDGDPVSATIEITPPSGLPFEYTTQSVASGNEVSFTVPTALEPGAYTWRARARDSQNALSDWSAPTRFTVPEPDVPPSAPELISPANGAYTSRTPVFRLKATDPGGQPVSFEIKVSAGSQTLTFTTDQVPSGTTLAFPVPDSQPLPIGAITWQARACDVSGNLGNWSSTRTLNVLGEVPRTLQGVQTFALSLRPSASDPNSLGLNGTILMRWNATAQQYASVSQLQPGEGYFVKATSPVRPDLQGESITGEIVLLLQPGWNLIANPSLTPIAWDLDTVQVQRGSERTSLREAQQAGWIDDYLWTWQQNPNDPMHGQYALVYDAQELPGVLSELEPWRAYWILAREECELVLNASGRGRATRFTREENFGNRRNRSAWALHIEAIRADGSSNAVWIGVSGGRAVMASPAPEPPENASPVQLRLRRSEGYFATDLRAEFGRSTRWLLEVEVAPGTQPQPITLRVGNLLRLPHRVNLALVDERTGTRRPLHAAGSFTFTAPASGGVYRFRIEPIASHALLRVLNPTVQGGRGTGQAFTLHFTLTAEARLQVQIRAGGRILRTLSDYRSRSAGPQQFLWDGRDDNGVRLPPGQYLAEIVAMSEDGQIARAAIPIVMTR